MLASYKKSLHAAFMVVFCLALGLRCPRAVQLCIDWRHRAGSFRRRRSECNG